MPNYNYVRELGNNKGYCSWFQQEPSGWEGHSGKDSCQQQVGQGQCRKSGHRKMLSIMSLSSHSLQSIEVGWVQGHINTWFFGSWYSVTLYIYIYMKLL